MSFKKAVRILGPVAALALLCPVGAAGQIPLVADIFSKLEDVNTSVEFGGLFKGRDLKKDLLRSIAFEVTLMVGSSGCRHRIDKAKTQYSCTKDTTSQDPSKHRFKVLKKVDARAVDDTVCVVQYQPPVDQPTTRRVRFQRGDTTVTAVLCTPIRETDWAST